MSVDVLTYLLYKLMLAGAQEMCGVVIDDGKFLLRNDDDDVRRLTRCYIRFRSKAFITKL